MPDIPSYEVSDEAYDDFEDCELGETEEVVGGVWKKLEQFSLAINEVEVYGFLSWKDYKEYLHGINHYL